MTLSELKTFLNSDKPLPPRDVNVTDVFKDNCIVHWRPPVDDGGTEISHYIIEALDLTEPCCEWNVLGHSKSQEFKAEFLQEGHRYKFRVSAVNKLGQSSPCLIKGDGVLIKDPWDPPSAPGQPKPMDWNPFSCHLCWSPPENDGGAAITSYVIEVFEKTVQSGWQFGACIDQVEAAKDGKIYGTCPGLTEGMVYTFRIKAINKGGAGPPSPPSRPEIIAKNRFGKFCLHIILMPVRKSRTIVILQ